MTFKKGEINNPKGRPKKPAELDMVRMMSKQQVELTISLLLNKKVTELEEILKDKSRPTMEHFVGRIIMMGIVNGDQQRLDFLFNRVIGRVRDQVDATLPEPYVVESVDGSRKIECGMIAAGKTIDAELA